MSRFRYEIDKKNAVSVFDDENPIEDGSPFFYQPTWPNNTEWASKAEAEGWVKAFINALENPESEFLAGDGPDAPLKPRKAPEATDPGAAE